MIGRVDAQRVPGWKRAMDVTVAAAVLVFGSPFLALVAIGNRIFLGSEIFYRQERGGHGGTTFEVIKFRSMRHEHDRHGNELAFEDRSHVWGELLRKTSLDEVPGLFNVVVGDMSLVGPRPLVARYLYRYDEEQARRHRLPPGLTGLAQTSGRNLISWEEKFELDNKYIDELSLSCDLKILANTALQIVTPWRERGTGHADEFLGASNSTSNDDALVGG